MKPVIGILTRYDVNQKGRCLNYVFDSTRTAILKMGGNPLLLCPMQNMEYYDTKYEDYVLPTEEEKNLATYWLDMCDGLFIPGGSKISPYDYFILEEALKRKIPILGVCLGMQLLANYKEDGVIEGIELKDYPFCIGLQWHPELMLDTDINSLKIFKYFIEEASKHNKDIEVVSL